MTDIRIVAEPKRYRGPLDFSCFPLGNNLDLVYAPITGQKSMVEHEDINLLRELKEFSSLEEHAQGLLATLNLSPDQLPALRSKLEAFAQAGLLVEHGALLDRFVRNSGEESPPPIASLGIPTRDRPQALERCLRSYALNARQFHRRLQYVVMDGSNGSSAGAKEENIEILKKIQQELNIEIQYIDQAALSLFASQLSEESGVAPSCIGFALLNDEGCPVSIGSSRNALLLGRIGEMMAQVDDDTVCRVAANPSSTNGLTLTSEMDPTQLWFPSREELDLSPSETGTYDFFACHEKLLGKSVATCVRDLKPDSVNLDLVSSAFSRRLERNARVLSTYLGFVGDSGAGGSPFLLSLDGVSRARLLQSEAHYKEVLRQHQLKKGVTSFTISDGGFCQSLNIGLDNRRFLPPFTPVQRSEDGVFGLLVRASGQGFFGYLPFGVQHRPISERQRQHSDLWKLTRASFGDITQILLHSFQPMITSSGNAGALNAPHSPDIANPLNQLGNLMLDLGSASSSEFEEVIRVALWGYAVRNINHLEELLKRYKEQPACWAFDVQSRILWMKEQLQKPDYLLAQDLSASFGEAEARPMQQRLIRRLGELLLAWPQLRTAAIALRARGDEMGVLI